MAEVQLLAQEKAALEQLTLMEKEKRNPTITESLFVSKYLPILTYNLHREEGSKGKVNTLEWINDVAKSPFNRVDVVDNKNKVLFWIPAILKQGGVYNQNSAKDSVYQLIKDSELRSSVAPGFGDRFLKEGFDRKLNGVNSKGDEDQAQWEYILNRYDLLKTQSKDSIKPNDAKKVSMDDFGDFDEF